LPRVRKTTVKIVRRQWLIGAIAIAAIITAGLLGWSAFGPVPVPDRESLFGLKIGDDRDDAIQRLGKPSRRETGDPWTLLSEKMRHAIGIHDLMIADADRNRVEVLTWDNDAVAAMVLDNQIRAIIATGPAAAMTGRGLKIGNSERQWKRRYRDAPDSVDVIREQDATWGTRYRYSKLGLTIDITDGKVATLSVFPKR